MIIIFYDDLWKHFLGFIWGIGVKLNLGGNGGVLGLWHPEYDGTVESPDVMLISLADSETKSFPDNIVRLIQMKEAKELDVGYEIGTLGYPGELESSQSRAGIRAIPTFKTGTISALRPYNIVNRSANPMGRVSNKIIQHDFNTTPGTSGSPIFNAFYEWLIREEELDVKR